MIFSFTPYHHIIAIAVCFEETEDSMGVILTIEIDKTMFSRAIEPQSYLYAAVLTAIFAAFVNFIMYFKIKRIDMVESLKSVE